MLNVVVCSAYTTYDFCDVCICQNSVNGLVICASALPDIGIIKHSIKRGNFTLLLKIDFSKYDRYQHYIDALFFRVILHNRPKKKIQSSKALLSMITQGLMITSVNPQSGIKYENIMSQTQYNQLGVQFEGIMSQTQYQQTKEYKTTNFNPWTTIVKRYNYNTQTNTYKTNTQDNGSPFTTSRFDSLQSESISERDNPIDSNSLTTISNKHETNNQNDIKTLTSIIIEASTNEESIAFNPSTSMITHNQDQFKLEKNKNDELYTTQRTSQNWNVEVVTQSIIQSTLVSPIGATTSHSEEVSTQSLTTQRKLPNLTTRLSKLEEAKQSLTSFNNLSTVFMSLFTLLCVVCVMLASYIAYKVRIQNVNFQRVPTDSIELEEL